MDYFDSVKISKFEKFTSNHSNMDFVKIIDNVTVYGVDDSNPSLSSDLDSIVHSISPDKIFLNLTQSQARCVLETNDEAVKRLEESLAKLTENNAKTQEQYDQMKERVDLI